MMDCDKFKSSIAPNSTFYEVDFIYSKGKKNPYFLVNEEQVRRSIYSLFRPTGCMSPKTVPIPFCVKGYTETRHFRVLIIIRVSQTHVFLKENVHINQMGSHFVGGDPLHYSPTEQETKTSILHAFSSW